MRPQLQTKFGKDEGNCVAACVASILELGVDEVPNFALHGFDWAERLEEWLAGRGYQMISLLFESGLQLERTWISHGHFVMLSGLSPRAEDGGNLRHAVVGISAGRGVDIVHDPHPSADNILTTHDVWVRFIVPLPQPTVTKGDTDQATLDRWRKIVEHVRPDEVGEMDELERRITAYDSTQDTKDHIEKVTERLGQMIEGLQMRGMVHDLSKLKEPEKSIFDAVTPKLKGLTYGSNEYKAALVEMGEAAKLRI